MVRLLILTAILTACGGDGGSSEETAPSTPATDPANGGNGTVYIPPTEGDRPMPQQPVYENGPDGPTDEQYESRKQEALGVYQQGIDDLVAMAQGVAHNSIGSTWKPSTEALGYPTYQWKSPFWYQIANEPQEHSHAYTRVEEDLLLDKCETTTKAKVAQIKSSYTFTDARDGAVTKMGFNYRLIYRDVNEFGQPTTKVDYVEVKWFGKDGVPHSYSSSTLCTGKAVIAGSLETP